LAKKSKKVKKNLRAVKVVLDLPKDATLHFTTLVKSYRHLQNLMILIRADLYRGAEPEKAQKHFLRDEEYRKKKAAEKGSKFEPREAPALDFDPESKKKHKALLAAFSRPRVIRALFQKANPGKKEKARMTRDENLKEKDLEKYNAMLEIRLKKAEKGGGTDQDKASLLKEALGETHFFKDFISVGGKLKSHVIFNLAKNLTTAYKNAFKKHADTGRLHLPKTEKLDYVSNFYINLCANSLKIKGDELLFNLSDHSVRVKLNETALDGYRDLITKEHFKIGIEMGKVVFLFSYIYTPEMKVEAALTQKNGGIDIGISNTAALFVDDDVSKSVVLGGREMAAVNARFNEKINRLCGLLDPVKSKMRSIAKVEKKKHFDLLTESKEYARLNIEAVKLNVKRETLYLKRRIFFEQTMHKLARRILEYFASSGVTTIYASKTLAGLKQAPKKQRKLETRRFHQIPIIKLVNYLELNAIEYGIKVEFINEAYTSKTSVFLNEVLKNQKRKESLSKLEGEAKISEELDLKLGTTLGGRRAKGKFIIHTPEKAARNRPYYHSDVGAAANHIQARGEAIIWSKEKKHKLHAPIKVNVMDILDSLHGGILGHKPSIASRHVRSVHV
jgi:IS605 OrfB family transposase